MKILLCKKNGEHRISVLEKGKEVFFAKESHVGSFLDRIEKGIKGMRTWSKISKIETSARNSLSEERQTKKGHQVIPEGIKKKIVLIFNSETRRRQSLKKKQKISQAATA